ncbi:MAG: prepilin peptidase [Verrucomicrobiales bacterium]|nr:prepilin peptidase [Verrucomicrobiales bacterium]
MALSQPEFVYLFVLPFFAFVIGASIGSFLNVVIYRVPNGLSVNEPKRSFCPNCKTQIPARYNIPLITWLMLRGKCKWCKEPIAFRYFMVELLTGICFLAIWQNSIGSVGLGGVIALWVLASLLISATFIDFDHFIIPDGITIGGTIVGIIASFAFPVLHEEEIWWKGGLQGIIGAAVGFALLYLVVLMGKLAFGKIKHEFDEPVEFRISQPGGEDAPIMIQLGEHEYEWGDVFFRKWDQLIMDIKTLSINDEVKEFDTFVVTGDGFSLDGERLELESVKKVSGTIMSAVVPREAMGFGDVKFVAMIGAFLGWECTFFTLFAASIVGAIVGLMQKFVVKEEWSRPLPFGPYLALGAFTWLFAGPAVWVWYIGALRSGLIGE